MDNNFLHRKISIVITVIDIIDELGIQGLSTREIAKRLGISEGTLFRHFKNKNEILQAVLDQYSQYDQDIIQSTKLKNLKPIEAIKYCVRSYAEYYENYPAITSINQTYEELRCMPQLSDRIQDIFNQRYFFIKELVEKAQKEGEICAAIDSVGLTDIIMGYFRITCLKWRMNGYNFPLKERILATLDMVISAFTTV